MGSSTVTTSHSNYWKHHSRWRFDESQWSPTPFRCGGHYSYWDVELHLTKGTKRCTNPPGYDIGNTKIFQTSFRTAEYWSYDLQATDILLGDVTHLCLCTNFVRYMDCIEHLIICYLDRAPMNTKMDSWMIWYLRLIELHHLVGWENQNRHLHIRCILYTFSFHSKAGRRHKIFEMRKESTKRIGARWCFIWTFPRLEDNKACRAPATDEFSANSFFYRRSYILRYTSACTRNSLRDAWR